ncbi:MAG: hypothetical protein ACMX3H_02485 [Sodalis sp. (in: enterobacteria)]|uniref:hypothetical protein n=1 Tax=Sodalis sp. (in: enterobacteria) TaxID=1898979 RepID=UPI0039E67930
MKVTLSAKDAGLEREIDTLLSLNRVDITEGIHEDAGSVDGISIAEYAAMNDLGTRHIPARPWLRSYWETQSERVMKAFERLSKINDLPTALEKLALWVERPTTAITSNAPTGRVIPCKPLNTRGLTSR